MNENVFIKPITMYNKYTTVTFLKDPKISNGV